MEREIKKVRKKIEQRKKERDYPQARRFDDGLFHHPEEKHGYPPEIIGSDYTLKGNKESITNLVMKAMLALILFISTAIVMNTSAELLTKPKEVASQLLTNEFPFAKVNVWYQDVFGSPLAIAPDGETGLGVSEEVVMPVTGDIVETFQMNGEGVKIAPSEKVDVVAHHEGVVVFAGKYPTTGKTITIQHADGTNSSYGNLSDLDVHLYQYVTVNQRLGTFNPADSADAVYFSLEKDNTFLDPVQVIEVDDGT